ncbi:hypothetical protein IFM89_037946 [Coptis chinensis]|uniref:Uncharacterized protein n=1 Tax=Coptis chinensis TaxID=261450 RepID=A0A835HSV2_9MAGN|nr:hypothetical protein IFM89_037946 [Coptis chinensis]
MMMCLIPVFQVAPKKLRSTDPHASNSTVSTVPTAPPKASADERGKEKVRAENVSRPPFSVTLRGRPLTSADSALQNSFVALSMFQSANLPLDLDYSQEDTLPSHRTSFCQSLEPMTLDALCIFQELNEALSENEKMVVELQGSATRPAADLKKRVAEKEKELYNCFISEISKLQTQYQHEALEYVEQIKKGRKVARVGRTSSIPKIAMGETSLATICHIVPEDLPLTPLVEPDSPMVDTQEEVVADSLNVTEKTIEEESTPGAVDDTLVVE